MASIYRALAEHAKLETYPEAVNQAHADFVVDASIVVARQMVGQRES